MSTRDYTDSESETEAALLGDSRGRRRGPAHKDSALSTPARSASPAKSADDHGNGGGNRGGTGHSLKITLRPNLTHLADTPRAESSSPGDRSSLSPPPPIRLKFSGGSMKHARSSAMYSDSEDEAETKPSASAAKAEDAAATGSVTPNNPRSPPAKKHKPSKPRSSLPPSIVPGSRKAYNWLTPSAVGASHHGPPDRGERHSSAAVSNAASNAGDDEKPSIDEGRESAPPSEKKKTVRRKAGEAGPGKNWRKGMRKGDPLPWKEGATFLGDSTPGRMGRSPLSTPLRPSVSREASPEPFDNMLLATATATVKEKRERERDREHDTHTHTHTHTHTPHTHQHNRYREPSPQNFVLADAKVMGIPVFPNPIVTPRLVLGTFPKVTSFFAPFDNKPFKKEKPRDWTYSERSITGVGGGTLKFKTWRPGPQSELGKVLAAQKEAEALAKQRKKENRENERLERGEATPERGASERQSERPSLHHMNSNDSVPLVGDAEGDGDNASEAGEDSESVAGSMRDSPAPRRGGTGKRGRPRKSKLANEIIPTEPEDETPSARPSAEPETKPAIAA